MYDTRDARPSGIPGRPRLRRWPRGLTFNSGTPRTPNTVQRIVERAAKLGVPIHVAWPRCMAHIAYEDMPARTPRRPKLGTDKWVCVCERQPGSLYCEYHTEDEKLEAAARLGAEIVLVGAVPVVA